MPRAIMALAIALLLPLFSVQCQSGGGPSEALTAFTGDVDLRVRKLMGSSIDLYKSPERIDAFIVASEPARRGERIETFPVMQRGPALSADQARRLQRIMFDVNSFNFNVVKKCPFTPHLGFVFQKDGESAHVLVCFACNEWSFGAGDRGAIEDMDTVRPELLRLGRELFPDDAALRNLEAGR